jgi:uncharacterized protein YbcI
VAEYLRVFRHVGFFFCIWRRAAGGGNMMNTSESAMAQQVAQAAIAYQTERTGHAPASVTVVLSEDTLVITLHDALSPAEKALATSAEGAAKVQEFHRQLFLTSADSLRKRIKSITGREVREASFEVDPATGSVVHAFTSGTMVQVFLLAEKVLTEICASDGAAASI